MQDAIRPVLKAVTRERHQPVDRPIKIFGDGLRHASFDMRAQGGSDIDLLSGDIQLHGISRFWCGGKRFAPPIRNALLVKGGGPLAALLCPVNDIALE